MPFKSSRDETPSNPRTGSRKAREQTTNDEELYFLGFVQPSKSGRALWGNIKLDQIDRFTNRTIGDQLDALLSVCRREGLNLRILIMPLSGRESYRVVIRPIEPAASNNSRPEPELEPEPEPDLPRRAPRR